MAVVVKAVEVAVAVAVVVVALVVDVMVVVSFAAAAAEQHKRAEHFVQTWRHSSFLACYSITLLG